MTVQVAPHPPESGWWHLAWAIVAHSTYPCMYQNVGVTVSQDWLPGPRFSRSPEESLIPHHHLLVTLGYLFILAIPSSSGNAGHLLNPTCGAAEGRPE